MNHAQESLTPKLIRPSMGRYGVIQETDMGSYYGVTTILRETMPEDSKRKIAAAWERKVNLYGKSKAAEYAEADRSRGNNVHAAIRAFFENRQTPLQLEPEYQAFGDVLLPIVAGISPGDFLGSEEYVCNPPRGYAARLDFRARWGGKHTVFELKTSFRSTPKDWLEDKILQATAEAMAFDWMYEDDPIEQVMVINVFASPADALSSLAAGTNCYLIDGVEFEQYKGKWLQRLELFKEVGADLLPTPARFF